MRSWVRYSSVNNQNAASMPTFSCWMYLRRSARQSSDMGSQSRSCGASCAWAGRAMDSDMTIAAAATNSGFRKECDTLLTISPHDRPAQHTLRPQRDPVFRTADVKYLARSVGTVDVEVRPIRPNASGMPTRSVGLPKSRIAVPRECEVRG